MPCSGKVLLDQGAHGRFGCTVSGRHGIKAPGNAFILDPQGGPEERAERFAGSGGKLFNEGYEIDRRHEASPWIGCVTNGAANDCCLCATVASKTGIVNTLFDWNCLNFKHKSSDTNARKSLA